MISFNVVATTVVFTSFPDSLRGLGHLFTTKEGYDVRSICQPELYGRNIYVCGENKNKDNYKLNFSSLQLVEDFVNSLEDYCLKRNISFSREGKVVLGGL